MSNVINFRFFLFVNILMYLFPEKGTHICMYDAENGTYNNELYVYEYNVCRMFSCSNTYFNAMYDIMFTYMMYMYSHMM